MLQFAASSFGISRALRLRGFNSFLPLSALLWLKPVELEVMLRGQVNEHTLSTPLALLSAVLRLASLPRAAQPPMIESHVTSHSVPVAGSVVRAGRLDGLFEAQSRLRCALVVRPACCSDAAAGVDSAPFVWLLEVSAPRHSGTCCLPEFFVTVLLSGAARHE